MTVTSLLYLIGTPLAVLLLLLIAYGLMTLLGALIPVHASFKPAGGGEPIYLDTNGMHTNFTLPATHEIFDWTSLIDPQLFEIDLQADAYLSFGWGDQAIYLDLPDWDQLTLSLGWRTLMLPTPALLHVKAHPRPPAGRSVRISLSEAQYAELCRFIVRTFALDQQGRVQVIPGAGYTENDRFYRAHGKYHALNTCNTWINAGLKYIGVRTPLWASIDRCLFYQLKKIPIDASKMIFENQGS